MIHGWEWWAVPTAGVSNGSRPPRTAGSTPSCPPSRGTRSVTSLLKTGIYKAGWGNLLAAGAASDHLDPHIRAGAAQGKATGTTTASNEAWFLARGPGDLVKDIHVPTLIVQGTVDTLFTLDEGITNYEQVKKDGVPVSMVWFCGGHGVCLTNQGNPQAVQDASIAWLNRWVKRDPTVATGPSVDRSTRTACGTRRIPIRCLRLPRSVPAGAGRCPWWPPGVPVR